MEDLSKFTRVKEAFEQVVQESDVNNGTQGLELLAHFWSQENVFDQKRQDIQTNMAKAVLAGSVELVKQYQEELAKLPKPKIVMLWKLITPIARLEGTMIRHDGDKPFKISMENVQMLYIPEDSVKAGLLTYEETEDKGVDMQGREATIVKLKLVKGIIDVAAPVKDRFDKEVRPKRAFVTIISYRAMQIAGQIMGRQKADARKRYGFDEQV